MKNYIKLGGLTFFHVRYAFVDTAEHIYLRVFSDTGIKVTRKQVFAKPGTGLRLVVCNVLKRDSAMFEEKMEEIRYKALLLGYRNYDELCEKLCELNCRSASIKVFEG